MSTEQTTFGDELANMRTKKMEFLAKIDCIVPWGEWDAEIKPRYYKGECGNKPRDLDAIDGKLSLRKTLNVKQAGRLDTIHTIYEQQKYMYGHRIHSVPNRIVGVS